MKIGQIYLANDNCRTQPLKTGLIGDTFIAVYMCSYTVLVVNNFYLAIVWFWILIKGVKYIFRQCTYFVYLFSSFIDFHKN